MPTPAPSRKDRKGHRRRRGRASAADMLQVLRATAPFRGTCTRWEYNAIYHPETCPACIEHTRAS